MRHPLVPSLEVLGALSVNDLSAHSFFESNPERADHVAPHSSSYLSSSASSPTE